MPWSAPNLHACGHPPTCGRCPTCAEKSRRDHDAKRPDATERGYGAAWRRARATYLALNPVCVRCGAKATVVDHVLPHRGDMRLFWDPSNWEPLCGPCHNSWKQAREKQHAAGRGAW